MKRSLLLLWGTVLVAALVAFGAARLAGRKAYRAPGANVILISVDTLRSDHLGAYGYERDTSPNIDRFAAENLLFENHFVTATTTLPSHTSMLTGLYLKDHGVLKNGVKLSPELQTLPEILGRHGYATAGFVSAFPLHSSTRFDQGFDVYRDVPRSRGAGATFEEVDSWLERRKPGPFFLFVHFFDPHGRHRPPAGYARWGRDKKSRYDGEILYTDEIIGRLLARLRELGLYDESLIMVTADHGQSMGERGRYGHGRSLYDECLRAPLLIHLPSGVGASPGRVRHQTSTVDFLPTILKLLGIKEQVPSSGLDLFGRRVAARPYVFAQRRHYEGQDDPVMRDLASSEGFEYGDKYAARGRGWKYLLLTRYPDEMYDLGSDPAETGNLLRGDDDGGAEARRMRRAIREWLADDTRRVKADLGVDEETRQRLRSLGYIN